MLYLEGKNLGCQIKLSDQIVEVMLAKNCSALPGKPYEPCERPNPSLIS